MSKGVALIGCGRIARRHAHAINEIDGIYIAGVCDNNWNKCLDFAMPLNTNGYTFMDNMIREVNPDIISVLTPSGLHAQHVIQLAPYGIPIIVEKPMALTLADADAMIDACQTHNTPLFVVKQNRFNLPIVLLHNTIKSLGRLISATVCVRWCRRADYFSDWHGTWALSGGVLANQASHHIDILQWMMGEPKSVFAVESGTDGIEVETTLMGVVRFKNNALGSIEVTTCARPVDTEGSITIVGERGLVKVGGFACNKLVTWQFEGDDNQLDVGEYSENPPDIYGFGHKAYYEHVIRCLDNKDTPLVDGIEARKGLALTIALYQSVEECREVSLDGMPYSSRLGR